MFLEPIGGLPVESTVGHQKRKSWPCGGMSAPPPESGHWTDIRGGPFSADSVAKVVLPKASKILRAAGAVLV